MNKYLVYLVSVAIAALLAGGCSWHVKGSASAGTKSKSEAKTDAKATGKSKSGASASASAKASGNSKAAHRSSVSVSTKGSAKARVYGTGKGKVKFSKKASTKVGRAKKPKNHRFKYKVSYKDEFSGKYKVGYKGRVESSVSFKARAKAGGKVAVASNTEAGVKKQGGPLRQADPGDAAAQRRDDMRKNETPQKSDVKVRIGDRREVVRYTIDDPTTSRRGYTDRPEQEIEEEDVEEIPLPPEEPPANEFGYETPVYGCFEGEVMFIEPNSKKLPVEYSNFEVASVLYACEWDIPTRAWETGFPGLEDKFEWFAIRYSGAFHLQEAGTYTFRINSDDGTKLYIDGQLVVDNDGVHPPRSNSGSIDLTAGDHELVLEYFQGPRYHIALQVFVTPPGGEEGIFSVRQE